MKLKLKPNADLPKGLSAGAPDGAPIVAVIDDEPGNVVALQALLQSEYRVIAFTDPWVALQHLSAHPADVVLTDQRMPGLLGTELLLRLKEAGHKGTAVIVTGYTDVKDLVLCINEELIFRYVLKPWEPEDIRAALREGVRSARRQRAVERLVPSQILGRVFPNGVEELVPGRSVQLACAVMFADLRGFSAVAESLPAQAAYELLHQYFSAITPLVASHGGFVEKFLGDGVLAIFDRPGRYQADARACARAIDRAARGFCADLAGHPQTPRGWRVGVGIASGSVMLGSIGCPDRVELSVLGDTVNTASRLEEACKFLGATVLLQHELADLSEPDYRPLGFIPLRGKDRVNLLGEICVDGSQGLAPSAELVRICHLQQAGQPEQALAILEDLAGWYPDDRVLQRMWMLWQTRRGASQLPAVSGRP